MASVESALRARRDAGGKSLVPYVLAGLTDDWTDYVEACVAGGADAVEVGLPFSDAMCDGPTIQAAATTALRRGATIDRLLEQLAGLPTTVPLVVMTYANLVRRRGDAAFCRLLAEAGASGLIVPDTPLDESEPLRAAAAGAGLELVMLVAPSTGPLRAARIAAVSRGFVYAVSNMGVTGQRETDRRTVASTVERARHASSLPVLVGFGISTPAQAADLAEVSDGVIVASALVQDVVDGRSAREMEGRVAALRRALDEVGGGPLEVTGDERGDA